MGLGQFVNWVGEQISSAVTGVVTGFQQIFDGDVLTGFLNVITFGAYGNLKDWIEDQIPETPEATYKDRKRTTTGAATPRQLIYGRTKVGGQLAYIGSTGADSQYLHIIIAVAPHEIEAIDQIFFNDELVSFADSPTTKYSGNLDVIIHLGDQTTADSTIVSRLPEWTSSHRLLGIAYVYLRLAYDDELFSSGVPSITFEVRGKNDIYDPRTDTTGYTNNHALCLLDYLQYSGGIRAQDSEIDFASFIDSANISDELVPGRERREVTDFNDSIFPWKWTWWILTTEARYTLNGTVSTAASIVDNLNSIARAGASTLVYTQGVWTVSPGEYNSPPPGNYFDESDIIGSVKFSPGPGKSQLINTAKGTYIDPIQDYEPVSFPEISPGSHLTRDGEELSVDIPMPFIDSPTRARRLAKIAVERERYGVTAEITLNYKAAGLRVGERIGITVERLNWINKTFRVETLAFSLSGGITLAIREDGAAVWDWVEGEALDIPPPAPYQIPSREPIAAPTDLVLTQELNTPLQPLGNQVVIKFTADPPTDDRFSFIKFQYRLQGDSQWIDIRYDVADSAVIRVFADGRTYEVSAQSVTTQGVVSNERLIDVITTTVVNRTDLPPDEPVIQVPQVTGLGLTNQGALITDWVGPDAQLEWDKKSITGGDYLDLHFDFFLVQVYRASDDFLLRTARVTDTYYSYTLANNINDTGGSPTRSIRVVVTAYSKTNYAADPTEITVSNPAPAAVTGISAIYTREGIELSYTPPADIDFKGIKVRGKLFTGSSITLEPMTTRAETLSIVSVDEFGDGATVGYNITNPAPAAVTGASIKYTSEGVVVSFTPPDNDYDYIGVLARGEFYDSNSFTIPPMVARSETLTITSVDSIGNGSSVNVALSNPAPAAVTSVVVEYRSEGINISFTPPTNDYDYVGVTARGNTYTSNSFTIAPMTSRSESLAITSVDSLGAGSTNTVALSNPAPGAPALSLQGVGFTNARINIGYPSDHDLIGANVRVRTTAGPGPWSSAILITSNEINLEGLEQGVSHQVEVRAVDTLGQGAAATITFTTQNIDVADVSGMSDWATETDPVDLAFINANMANDAVSSNKIASLTVAKLTAGQVTVQVDLGTGILLNGEDGYIQTINSGYSVFVGPVSRPSLSSNPVVLHDWNSGISQSTFWFDLAGNYSLGKGGYTYDISDDIHTFGNPSTEKYFQFDNQSGEMIIGRETTIQGVKSWNSQNSFFSGYMRDSFTLTSGTLFYTESAFSRQISSANGSSGWGFYAIPGGSDSHFSPLSISGVWRGKMQIDTFVANGGGIPATDVTWHVAFGYTRGKGSPVGVCAAYGIEFRLDTVGAYTARAFTQNGSTFTYGTPVGLTKGIGRKYLLTIVRTATNNTRIVMGDFAGDVIDEVVTVNLTGGFEVIASMAMNNPVTNLNNSQVRIAAGEVFYETIEF